MPSMLDWPREACGGQGQRHQSRQHQAQQVSRCPCPWLGSRSGGKSGGGRMRGDTRALSQGQPGIKSSFPAGPLAPGGWVSLHTACLMLGKSLPRPPSQPQPCLSFPFDAETLSARIQHFPVLQPHGQGLQTLPTSRAISHHRLSGRKGRGFILKHLRIYKRGSFILKREGAILAA